MGVVHVGNSPIDIDVNPIRNMVMLPITETIQSLHLTRPIKSLINLNEITVGALPVAVAVNPNTNLTYVTNSASNTMITINGVSNSPSTSVSTGRLPIGVDVNPNRNTIYVANSGDNTVSVIDGKTNTVTKTVTVGALPVGVSC